MSLQKTSEQQQLCFCGLLVQSSEDHLRRLQQGVTSIRRLRLRCAGSLLSRFGGRYGLGALGESQGQGDCQPRQRGLVGQMARENDLFTMIHGGLLPLVDGLASILRTYLASFPSSKATKSWNTGVPATCWWSMQRWPHVSYPLLLMVSPQSHQQLDADIGASGPFSGLQAAWTAFIGDPKKKSQGYTQEPIDTSHFRKNLDNLD